MPMIGLGTYAIPASETYDVVREAIRIGYRHIDCAPIYQNEVEIGQAIKDAIADGDVTRSELWVTSKLWNSSHRYNDVEPTCEDTLSKMQLEYLDLYLIHWPVAHERGIDLPQSEEEYLSEDEAPLEDTWTGMEDCLDAKLVKHIGVSNFNIDKLKIILEDGVDPPEVNQCEWHPYLPQQGLYDFCRSNKILMTAYAPLGTPGQMKSGEPELLSEPSITEIATKHDCTPAQALLAYAITRKMAAIPKSSNPERLKENIAVSELKLDREDLRNLIVLSKHRYIKGNEFTANGSPYKLTDFWEY